MLSGCITQSCFVGTKNHNHFCPGFERERPQPRICTCQNGGVCIEKEGGTLSCSCVEGFMGPHCENYVKKERIQGDASGSFSPAAIVIPLLLVLIVTLGGAAFYVFLRKRNLFGKQMSERGFGGIRAFGGGGGAGAGGVGSSVVSFRQGSNVEFTNPALVSGQPNMQK